MAKRIACLGVLFVVLFSLVACRSSHGIPNGKYNLCNDDGAVMTTEFYWQVSGDSAKYYTSGAFVYKCDIMDEDGKIYFVFDGGENRTAFKDEVKYDAATGILTVRSVYYKK